MNPFLESVKIQGMKTRMEKWRRYREKIESLPDDAFPESEPIAVPLSDEDKHTVGQSSPAVSISYPSLGKKGRNRATPYSQYRKRERIVFILEIVAFVVVFILLLLLYFFWVAK